MRLIELQTAQAQAILAKLAAGLETLEESSLQQQPKTPPRKQQRLSA